MNILILGSGAREHALCWAVKNSNYCKNLFCIPGNGGIAKIATCVKLSLVDNKKILAFCRKRDRSHSCYPEDLLERGIVDFFTKRNKNFWSFKKGVKLETSKKFAKDFMKNGIPTASFNSFSTLKESRNFISKILPFCN